MEYKVGDKIEIEIEKVYIENKGNKLYKIRGTDVFLSDAILDKIKNKDENKDIHINDVVTVGNPFTKYVCSKDNVDGNYTKCHLISSDGTTYIIPKSICNKTGEVLDIQSTLDKLIDVLGDLR